MKTLDLAAHLVYTNVISRDEVKHDHVYLALVNNGTFHSVEVVQACKQGDTLVYYKFGYEPELYEEHVTPVFNLVCADILEEDGKVERYLETLILGSN